MQNHITITPAAFTHREAIVSLLKSEKLPVEDLSSDLSNFFIATDRGLVVGVIGLETYEQNGLLRSLVVKPDYRKMKVAAGLINELEKLCKNAGLKNIYLLTETAQEYFSKKGYAFMNRSDAPVSLQRSSEFSHTCPATAILMQKQL